MKFVKNVSQMCGVLLVVIFSLVSAAVAEVEFTTYENCRLQNEEWNDGDSFHVKLADGRKMVFRLYGVDCVETSSKEDYMRQRLDAQAYYFGAYRNDGESKQYERMMRAGKAGTQEMKRLLAKPFKVITQGRNARGKFGDRTYAYVITGDGVDLGKMLVSAGLARVYGFHDELPRVDEGAYRQELYDLEMKAIGERNGIWRLTEWRDFSKERVEYRRLTGKININTVKNDDATVRLIAERSGVSEKDVKSLIAGLATGPYESERDLTRVKGIGEKTAKLLSVILKFK